MRTRTIHQLVANAFIDNFENKKCVDHIDNNKTNNNINNLRWATLTENQQNRQLNNNNTSGCKGIYFNKKCKKWYAQITVDGTQIHLGYFDNIEDAKKARVARAKEVFGIFLNNCEL
jgi:hypothetical protein